MNYIQHFGEHSKDYLDYRPTYPPELYEYLIKLVPEHQLAWDCGTGNGQAAVELARYFANVVASDVNQSQLDVAMQRNNIQYECMPAEKTTLENASVDLVTVAQALHWFKFDEFYREIKRVAKPHAMIAAWAYTLSKINTQINRVLRELYDDILGDEYWPTARRYIDEEYSTIPFPFQRIETPRFHIEKKLTLPQFMGYLNTWSAVKEYQARKQCNPVDLIATDLQNAWGESGKEYVVHWPIYLLVGKVHTIS